MRTTKNAGDLLAAMQMRRYDTGRIARWSTSGASLKATGCHHWFECLHRISPAATIGDKFVETMQNTNNTQLVTNN
jgi:hypothetical protein